LNDGSHVAQVRPGAAANPSAVYVPRYFRQDDPAVVRAAIRAARLGSLVTQRDGELFASHVPMLLEDEPAPHGRLIAHLARANKQWRAIGDGTPALVIFHGPDAYVTPSFYESKRDHGKVVPTWDYIAIHAYGTVRVIDDADAVHAIVTKLTDAHEARRAEPWAVDDAPADYIASELRAIVGIEIAIERFDAKWKLSQNREERDIAGVRDGLAASADAGDRALAHALREAAEKGI
jgi:transcriptional regulator